MWQDRKWLVVALACCFLLVTVRALFGPASVTASRLGEGQMKKRYRGQAPQLCFAFVSEAGRPLRLVPAMEQVYAQMKAAKRVAWESVLVDIGGSEEDTAALKRRFAIDVAVLTPVRRAGEWAANAALLAGCRAPFAVLIREDAPVLWEGTEALLKQAARLKTALKAIGVYLEPSASECGEDESKMCKTPASDHSGAMLINRAALAQMMPVYMEEQHEWGTVAAQKEFGMLRME